MQKKQAERIAVHTDENGDATLYATKATFDLLARTTRPVVYAFTEDASGQQCAYEINIELWSRLPAKTRKAIRETE